MTNFTHDELNLMAIYNTGSREGLIEELKAMRVHLEEDETELRELTETTITKLNYITDAQYAVLDLTPDFI